ncbi:hypothetical protein GIB67_015198 [Kingdonia uniflora]|uniref:Transmembrane protein 208 n=1 Tax=Kingdonia uniflora TaxID=39325 RepID=A0A7J7MSV1_9MAGN|nr:hypothetical protein GIB67_015198 [Kingdonia uniflora]
MQQFELSRKRERQKEMANQGAKKRKEENSRHMAKLLRIIIACNSCKALLKMIRGAAFTLDSKSSRGCKSVGMVWSSVPGAVLGGYLLAPGLMVQLLEVYVSGGFACLVSRLFLILHVIYVMVRLFYFHSTFTWKHWVGLIVTSIGYAIPYQQLAKMANPSYADGGELLDGGFDMSTDGVCGYLHDVIYITSFIQLMSILSGKFWYTYLVIPAFGSYKLFGLMSGFMSHGSEGGVEDDKTRKKREKMEKKASRGKFVKTRSK